MLKHRIIPVLYFNKQLQVVQTTQFKRPYRNCGSLMQYIENMEQRNIDEIILIDLDATLEGREPLFKEIKEFTSRLFCPVTYGGGISKLDDVKRLIQDCGADKISIKTNYFKLIDEVTEKFGKQVLVQSIDIGNNFATVVHHGAGELLVTYINQNGTQEGYNLDIFNWVHKYYSTPVVINGGCGSPDHMIEAIKAGASAVAASSMFLFTEHTPKSCAKALHEAGVPVRLHA